MDTCTTCVQNFRVYLLKTARTFGLSCGKQVHFTLLLVPYVITWFECRSFALCSTQHLTQAGQIFECNVYVILFTDRHALEYLKSPRSEKKWGKKKIVRKCLIIYGLFDGLWSVGTRFHHQRQSQVLQKKVISPSLTVRGGEYDTKMCNIRIDGASGICEGENFCRHVLPQLPKCEKQDRPFP